MLRILLATTTLVAAPALAQTAPAGSPPASGQSATQASAGAQPQLLVADVDLDAAQKARETIAVLRNRSVVTHLGKAESLR